MRVHPETRDALARLAAGRGLTTADLVAEVVARHEEDGTLEQMNDAFARQQSDVDAWRLEQQERRIWDRTLLDGLERL